MKGQPAARHTGRLTFWAAPPAPVPAMKQVSWEGLWVFLVQVWQFSPVPSWAVRPMD